LAWTQAERRAGATGLVGPGGVSSVKVSGAQAWRRCQLRCRLIKFRLRYRVTGSAVVVASTGWGSGWDSLGNGEVLTICRHSLGGVCPLDPRQRASLTAAEQAATRAS
jgi:hypothetical protein